MRRFLKLPFLTICTLGLAVQASAETVSVTDGTGNVWSDAAGWAIDFNTNTSSAVWAPALVEGSTYSVDSVTVFSGNNSNDVSQDTDFYVGVYTNGPTDSAQGTAVSGFLGASTNTVNFGTLAESAPATFNFSGINVVADATPGGGSGVLYFVLQTGTTAVTDFVEANSVRLRRIDGNDGTFEDELSAILDGRDVADHIRVTRSPEYQASVTLVPEPGSLTLLAVGGLCILRRRRG